MQQTKTHQVPVVENDFNGRARSPGASSLVAFLSSCVLSALLVACNIDIPQPMTDVHVQVLADGSCSIEHEEVACADLGARLEQKFPRHDCHILLDVDQHATFEPVGAALRSIQSHDFVKLDFSHG